MVKSKRSRTDFDAKNDNYRHVQFEFVSADISNVPFCEHGPTMLLERLRNGKIERFHACAVCRSRKDCHFYRSLEDERRHPMSLEKMRLVKKIMKARRQFTHKQLYKRLKSYRKYPPEHRLFCSDCSTIILNVGESKKHEADSSDGRSHQIINGISNRQLRQPSQVLRSLENDKKEAQYLFARETLSFLAENVITKLGFDGVLCLGTPRLKEFLQKPAYRNQCKSFLLDIDYRYAQFWSPRFFAEFNVFNGYFYTKLGENCFQQFLGEVQKLLIVVDPPYGGLVTPLVQTLIGIKQRFEKEQKGVCEVVYVSPYFMESKLCGAFQGMTMLDYKVTYEGEKFSTKDGGSYIRIFTTLNPSTVELPSSLGYKYCDQCKRYVASENRHCKSCNACTSKDGRPYVHCQKCEKCVKRRYKHCKKCDHCHKQPANGGGCRPSTTVCQLCREEGHLWMQCPTKDQPNANPGIKNGSVKKLKAKTDKKTFDKNGSVKKVKSRIDKKTFDMGQVTDGRKRKLK